MALSDSLPQINFGVQGGTQRVSNNADCCAVGPGRRASSPLVRLVEGEERWEVPDHLQGVLPQNCCGNEPNRSVTCLVLEATDNDRRHLALCHDEFRGPRFGLY
ncbi:uncharacterized protein TNCV_4269551 [Trichonephila clavipes]|nr:uncharacterized protein TNCV_4269551 [Trichonephila clavipes]